MNQPFSSVGFDRHTGGLIYDWDHVVQSLGVLWSTEVGERILREDVGNPGLRLLGENMTTRNVLRFWQCLKIVTDLWEPRFSIVQISPRDPTPETMRQGAMGFVVTGVYRPRAHLGDRTPEGRRSISVDDNGNLI